jgi:RNA polymerase sigma factor (TIGR02999 family)
MIPDEDGRVDRIPQEVVAPQSSTTQLLIGARGGDRESFDRLFARVYEELRRIAHHRRLEHAPAETLSTTVLVHEAYLRLIDGSRVEVADRSHFLALASRAMRFVLVDHARARQAAKRGGGAAAVSLDDVQLHAGEPAADILALNDALERLTTMSERQARLVEYRFFGGLSYGEIAGIMDISERTAKREWVRARTWLYNYMNTAAS